MPPFTARVVTTHRRRRSGGVGRLRQSARAFPKARPKASASIRSSPMAFFTRSKRRARPAGRSGWTPGACDRRGPRRPDRRRGAVLSQEPQPWASTSSTTPGPTPTPAPAANIIRSSRSPRPSRPRPDGACWSPATPRRAPRRRWSRDCARCGGRSRRRRSMSPSRPPRTPRGSSGWAFWCATASSSTFFATAFRISTTSSRPWPPASARASSASGGTRSAMTSPSNG